MRLSTKGRYAVMAMADLASFDEAGKPVSLADIAQRQEISLSYLEQLFAKLRRGGLVRSVRGPGGGYRLSRPAAELRVADIVMAVDEPLADAADPRRAATPIARETSPLCRNRLSSSSDLQLGDKRIDHGPQIAVMLLGDAPLPLIGRAPSWNVCHRGEFFDAIQ